MTDFEILFFYVLPGSALGQMLDQAETDRVIPVRDHRLAAG